MNPMVRMAFRFIKVTLMLVIMSILSFILCAVIYIYLLDWMNPRGAISMKTFLVVTGFVLTFIFFIAFGWCVGKPLTYLIRWINRLSEKNYSLPLEHFRQPKGVHRLGGTDSHDGPDDSGGTDYTKGSDGSGGYDSSDGLDGSDRSLHHNHYRYPYALYKELFDRMHLLSNQLQRSDTERLNLEAKKKEWIAAISHDLKTPLSYIEGYAHMLAAADYDWSDEEKQNFSRQISGKTAEMKQLIHDLNQAGRWSIEQFPMNKKTDDVVNFLRDMMIDIANHPLAEQASFMFTAEDGECMMEFDSRLLGRAFQNVMMNAVIHNPPGTQVQCNISLKENHCYIVIEDDGAGIEETKRRQALDESGKGIAIANAFVEAHAGCMSIAPADDKGTRVEIVLPILP
ncbi:MULTISPECIES: sensor histidine kinase [Paenibacillus]|uniref:sensor histidine kinase n=1 Tax=Paenibacillus TaxID=44249 RepID=UPI00048D91CB|nr:HAMP domain-containing sensor histidine kinase [Paenibacillus sp. IHBB 10380]